MKTMGSNATADWHTLMHQAWMTADLYMRRAIEQLDGAFGEGYAATHPELVAAFMTTSALDYHDATIAKVAEEVGWALVERLDLIAEVLNAQVALGAQDD